MSNLSQVLSEYSVPLQVWLSPEARVRVAEILIPAMGDKADIVIDPMTQLAQLRGPAVLVITAKELTGADQELLRILAKKAHPGRSVLVGGTSDRDTLMNAINNWGVVRVVGGSAEDETLINAVREAGLYLNREVAMETAIDDLDIETTMIDSAIDQLHGTREQIRHVDRTNMATTFAAGMMTMLERERAWVEKLEKADLLPTQHTTKGLQALINILEMAHDFAIEQSAGIPVTPTSVDAMVDQVRTLSQSEIPGHSGSGALVSMDPYVLFQGIMAFAHNESLLFRFRI